MLGTNQTLGKMDIRLDRDVDQFLVFELVLNKRGRTWRWNVCTTEGATVMVGSESSRPAAKYQAERALFLLLLSAPYRLIRLSRAMPPGPAPSLSNAKRETGNREYFWNRPHRAG
jgi:hypothetical protein